MLLAAFAFQNAKKRHRGYFLRIFVSPALKWGQLPAKGPIKNSPKRHAICLFQIAFEQLFLVLTNCIFFIQSVLKNIIRSFALAGKKSQYSLNMQMMFVHNRPYPLSIYSYKVSSL